MSAPRASEAAISRTRTRTLLFYCVLSFAMQWGAIAVLPAGQVTAVVPQHQPIELELVSVRRPERMPEQAASSASTLTRVPRPKSSPNQALRSSSRLLQPSKRPPKRRADRLPLAGRKQDAPSPSPPDPHQAPTDERVPVKEQEAPATPAVDAAALAPARVASAYMGYSQRDVQPPASVPTGGLSSAERGALLSSQLRADGAYRRYLRKRPPPKLHPQTDGSYLWYGPRFTARIAPDGQVAFDDEPNFAIDEIGVSALSFKRTRPSPYKKGEQPAGAPPPQPEAALGPITIKPLETLQEDPPRESDGQDRVKQLASFLPLLTLSGHFDLSDIVQAALSKDPRAPERRWFLDQTADFRRQLEAASRQQRASREPPSPHDPSR